MTDDGMYRLWSIPAKEGAGSLEVHRYLGDEDTLIRFVLDDGSHVDLWFSSPAVATLGLFISESQD